MSPLTGEFLCDAGEEITAELAELIERSGVNDLYLRLDAEREIKVFSNGTIYPEYILGYNLKDCGINEKVKFRFCLKFRNSAERMPKR